MDCRHLENLYELFLLGALDEGEAAKIQIHIIQGCPACAEGLRRAAMTVCILLQPAKPAPGSDKQKSHFLRRLKNLGATDHSKTL